MGNNWLSMSVVGGGKVTLLQYARQTWPIVEFGLKQRILLRGFKLNATHLVRKQATSNRDSAKSIQQQAFYPEYPCSVLLLLSSALSKQDVAS